MARYSLADYILTVTLPASLISTFGETISIGGANSYLDSISISRKSTLWSTAGDNTGSWVHNKNLDKTGSVTVSLNMRSDKVVSFARLCNVYYNASTNVGGLTLTVTSTDGQTVATCNDCYLEKIPDQTFGNTAASQSWSFTCGEVNIL